MTSSTARGVALNAIRRVVEHGGYSNLVLPAALARSGLDARDRALASELAFGTLRRLLALDRAIGKHSARPVDEVTPHALALLRMGAYQLLEMRIPPHAAVSETVGLAFERERGFVNAVLRRLADSAPTPPSGSSDDDVSVRTGLSPWAVRELRRIVGDEAEVAAAALASRGGLALRTNTCRTSVDELRAALAAVGLEAVSGSVHPETLLVDGVAPAKLPGFADGWFAVQDQASAFVVRALDPRPGERVLDVCASPGGKACHIACLTGPEGLTIAADVATRRLGLVKRTAGRLRVRVLPVAMDGRRPAVRGPFDAILVDAPCSGIGSARRRPELLWRPRREDLSGLARLQVTLASQAAGLLRPGGRLVYSVCTFPRAETDAACDAILRKVPALRPEAIEGPDGSSPRVRLWPHRHGTDAMFVAAFRLAE